MSTPIRLICPECDTIHRVKKLTLGKSYNCKKCSTALITYEPFTLSCSSCDFVSEPAHIDVSRSYFCDHCGGVLLLSASDSSDSSSSTLSSSKTLSSSSSSTPSSSPVGDLLKEDISLSIKKLSLLLEVLAKRLDLLQSSEATSSLFADEKLLLLSNTLSSKLSDFEKLFLESHTDLSNRLSTLQEKFSSNSSSFSFLDSSSDSLSFFNSFKLDLLHDFSRHLEQSTNRLISELEFFLQPLLSSSSSRIFSSKALAEELSLLLSQSLSSGGQFVSSDPTSSPSSSSLDYSTSTSNSTLSSTSSVIDYNLLLSRFDSLLSTINSRFTDFSEDLVRFQDRLSIFPSDSFSSSDFSNHLVTQISKSVESQIVTPITKALASQAPQILSDIQDEKLLEISTRAAKEAQRPVLQALMSSGRTVPAWLFGVLLFLFLLVLGYFLLPGLAVSVGEYDGYGDMSASLEDLHSQSSQFNTLFSNRLGSVETMLKNLEDKAWLHVSNSATLSERVRNLEKDLSISQQQNLKYQESLESCLVRIRAYESQLYKLGVNPASISVSPLSLENKP